MKTKTNKKMSENGYKVGDYLYSMWGYDQTNIDFFKVVGVTAKTLRIVPVQSRVVKSDVPYRRCVVPADKVDECCVFDKRGDVKKRGYMIKRVGSDMTISISGFAVARKWHGGAMDETSQYL